MDILIQLKKCYHYEEYFHVKIFNSETHIQLTILDIKQ